MTACTAVSTEVLLEMYRRMVEIRLFEERVAELIEVREIQTSCHLCVGQEAVPAGICPVLEPGDTQWGTHRSHGHYLAAGGEMNALMAELFGRTTGCSGGRGGSIYIASPEAGLMGTSPVAGGTVPLAVGAALASRLQDGNRVAVSWLGDGSLDQGHVGESLNVAALRQLPVLFVCENNLYAGHLPLARRRVNSRLCDVAAAYGVPAEQVDGNSAEAVCTAASRAVERARRGKGPTFLECRTYRWLGHSGADRELYASPDRKHELREWIARDPLELAAAALQQRGIPQKTLLDLQDDADNRVTASVAFARRSSAPDSVVPAPTAFRAA